MIRTLAISGYRSLHEVVLPLQRLTLITGANGSGKSNVYAALRLLAATARGRAIGALAREGGLPSVLWAGPQTLSRAMREGHVPVQGGPNRDPVRVKLGFTSDDYGYAIELGMPTPDATSRFNLDPEIKRETVWHGDTARRATTLIERRGPRLSRRDAERTAAVDDTLQPFEGLLENAGDRHQSPEAWALRRRLRDWRFYADFRTDRDAPARAERPATRTPILHHDGHDLGAALQTIREVGDADRLDEAIDDAFPGTRLVIESPAEGLLRPTLSQPGLLRALGPREWSDGTLRYVLLCAALLTPRPPGLMVLNEPENSLHPDLLPALARLIRVASERSQVWVVTHAEALVARLEGDEGCELLDLEKRLGATSVRGLRELDRPAWRWP